MAPLAIAGSMTALMAGLMGLLVWVFLQNPVNGLPLPLLLISLALLALVTGGVLAALFQRLREIGKGEIDDAKNY